MGFKSRGRLAIHFPGWDLFWDDFAPRQMLQTDPKARWEDDVPKAGDLESNIRR